MDARIKRPTPAFVVALVALFFALGGTAGAIATQAVPLAKRALVADNAKKLGGQTAGQLSAQAVRAAQAAAAAPGPASTAAGLMTIKTASGNLAADGEGEFTVSCDAGQKAAGGGFSSDGAVFAFDSYPASDTSWRMYLANLSPSSGAAITLYVTCLR